MSDREEFERWYASKNDGFCPTAYEGEYDFADAQMCWEAWQMARSSGGKWIKCSERLPEIMKVSRNNQNGILVRFDNGRITQFREVSERLVSEMKNGPRQPLKFESATPARITHWMPIWQPSEGSDK